MYSQLQEGAVEAGASDGQEVGSAETPLAEDSAAPVRRPTSLATLKAEIARAMQVAADRERERIDAGVGEEETAQVEKIFGRAAAEAAELSKHADEDVSVVNAWYKDQVKRIRADADRRIDDRRAGLEQSLTHHGSLIEAEIESVHVAVQGYRGSLGAFFGRLAEERDPSAIARLAGDLPDPPDLDEVRAEARSAAMQALQQRSAPETPAPADKSSRNGNGRTGPARESVPVMDTDAVQELVPVMDPGATDEPAGTSSDTTTPVAEPSEASAPQGNVAVRVIRALTNRVSATGAPEDQ